MLDGHLLVDAHVHVPLLPSVAPAWAEWARDFGADGVMEQVWAPALVGWVGGANWSAGGSPGASSVIAWYPLAPWERYEPWYRTNANYLGRINSAVQDRAPRGWQGQGDDWRRLNRDRATTVVQRDAMLDRRPVQHSIVAIAPASRSPSPSGIRATFDAATATYSA